MMAFRRKYPASILAALATVILLGSGSPTAFAQHQLWLKHFGTSGPDDMKALLPDGAGGVFGAGVTWGAFGAPYAGHGDLFVARFGAAGELLWASQTGTSERDVIEAMAPDGSGGVFLTGSTQLDLAGPHAGEEDIILARYDSAGNQLWIRQFGSSETEEALAAASDGAGGVFIGGKTDGNLGAHNLGYRDGFLAHYDGAGNQLWLHQFGAEYNEYVEALAPDDAGGFFAGGRIDNPPPGARTIYPDAFIARYDSEGNQLWLNLFGGEYGDTTYGLAPDGAGGVLASGATSGNLGVPNPINAEIFVTRYDGEGNRLWVRQFGSDEYETAYGFSSDGLGGAMLVGYTRGRLAATSAGGNDIFAVRYDGDGNRVWAHQFGSRWSEIAAAVTSDGAGGVVVGGRAYSDFIRPPSGYDDFFLARYETDPCFADCDRSTGNGVLDIFDFLCWQSEMVAGNAYACDCDTSTGQFVCDAFDFLCFQESFIAGCP